MSKWIETNECRLGDGRRVLAWWDGCIMVGMYSLAWNAFDLSDDLGGAAVHASMVPYWRPLPKPPKKAADGK